MRKPDRCVRHRRSAQKPGSGSRPSRSRAVRRSGRAPASNPSRGTARRPKNDTRSRKGSLRPRSENRGRSMSPPRGTAAPSPPGSRSGSAGPSRPCRPLGDGRSSRGARSRSLGARRGACGRPRQRRWRRPAARGSAATPPDCARPIRSIAHERLRADRRLAPPPAR